MGKVEEVASLEFKWLKKRGVGGKKKEIQFYESFMYDGEEYALYDCVYMYKEGLSEPYIGKLIKIWEPPDKTKKVKVQWFFRPEEVLKWLGATKTHENEILLASGEGHGLANINPLEAIAGRCNVVCVSKDCRNPQPSNEELEAADYIFYRTFDVQSCTISDKMGDKVGGLEIKYIFNRKEGENIGTVPKCTSDRKEENKNAASNEPLQLLTKSTPDKFEVIKEDGSDNQLKVEVEEKEDSQAKDVRHLLEGKETLPAAEPGSGAGVYPSKGTKINSEMHKTDECVVNSDKDKMKLSKISSKQMEAKDMKKTPLGSKKDVPFGKDEADKGETELGIVPVNKKVEAKERNSTPRGLNDLQDRPSKKFKPDDYKSSQEKQDSVAPDSDRPKIKPLKNPKVDNSAKSPVDRTLNEKILALRDDNLKALAASGSNEDTPNQKKDNCLEFDKETSSPKAMGDLEGKTLNKERAAKPLKVLDNKNSNPIQNLSSNKTGDDDKDLVAYLNEKPNQNSSSIQNLSSNKDGERKRKLSVIKSPKLSDLSTDKDKKMTYQEFVVTPKPIDDRKAWFKLRPWEERLQKAYGQGVVVLLHNLDPDYTSAEVEDIIWHALSEHCEAKMIQRCAVSSPHCGQAFVILKTKEAAQRVLKKLDNECLMLSNGRPLVGTVCPPISSKKHSKFFGHLVIDKIRIQNQRDTDEAVSTSHYSQPNTIEYDMAMEWFLLQKRSQKWWNMIHKQQGDELRKLEANLRKKKT